MQRRSFLAGMLAVAAAPAIVRASSLMPLWVPKKEIIQSSTASRDFIDSIPSANMIALRYMGMDSYDNILKVKAEAGHMYTVFPRLNDGAGEPVRTMVFDGKEWAHLY
jgi:hypothetical protein